MAPPRNDGPSLTRRGAIGIFAMVATAAGLGVPLPALAQSDPDLPNPPSNLKSIPAGALVIPMDTTLQGTSGTSFNVKAYGLIYALLAAKIPVYWAIKSGKAKDGVDFSASVTQVLPSTTTTATTLSFRGGPFVVPAEFATTAKQIASSYANSVNVYALAVATTIDIRYTLTTTPKVAVGVTNSAIHTNYLSLAGWPGSSYAVLDPATLSAASCYTIVTEPHTDATAAQIAAVQSFVNAGGNFFAECEAIQTYENNGTLTTPPPSGTVGQFQTTSGITVSNVTQSTVTYYNADLAFNQFDGELNPATGGSVNTWNFASGSSFQNNGYECGNESTTASSTGQPMLATVAKLRTGVGSLVFYLGGHNYAAGPNPLNSLLQVNGLRMYLNSLLVPAQRTSCPDLTFGAIVGHVYIDTNGNKVQDSGEANLGGLPVTLVGPSGTFTTTTDANGNYSFGGLTVGGSYTVTVSTPAGYTLTTNNNPQTIIPQSGTIGTATPVGFQPAPNIVLSKSCAPNGCVTGIPNEDLTYSITFTNQGGANAASFTITDPVPTHLTFKVGTATTTLATTGLSVTIVFSKDGGTTFTYTPVSGGGGAPTGYDANVTTVRWSFTGSLGFTSPNNTGSVSFVGHIN